MSDYEETDNFLSYAKSFTGIRAFDHGIDTCTWDLGIEFSFESRIYRKATKFKF